METIGLIVSVLGLLATILPFLFKKYEQSGFDKKYKQLRCDVAEALAMYSCCYHNPVDLAKQIDHKLPAIYETASAELRKLASTASTLSVTKPKLIIVPRISKADLDTVSGYLYGLANSMTTPYDCYTTNEERKSVVEWENEIRRILNIQKVQ